MKINPALFAALQQEARLLGVDNFWGNNSAFLRGASALKLHFGENIEHPEFQSEEFNKKLLSLELANFQAITFDYPDFDKHAQNRGVEQYYARQGDNRSPQFWDNPLLQKITGYSQETFGYSPYKKNLLFYLTCGEKIIGLIVFSPINSSKESYVHINFISVHSIPDCKRKGIGEFLIKCVIAYVKCHHPCFKKQLILKKSKALQRIFKLINKLRHILNFSQKPDKLYISQYHSAIQRAGLNLEATDKSVGFYKTLGFIEEKEFFYLDFNTPSLVANERKLLHPGLIREI